MNKYLIGFILIINLYQGILAGSILETIANFVIENGNKSTDDAILQGRYFPGRDWDFGCDFKGNDLANARVRGEDCSNTCAKTPGCTHYAWTLYNGGTCWMKKGCITKSNAIPGDPNGVCGIVAECAVPSPTNSKFPGGSFKSGRAFDTNLKDYSEFDYVSIWINTIDNTQNTNFNIYYQGEMIKKCIEQNKIPLFYAYIIAFEGRVKKGLQDCDVNNQINLCTHGSQFIRDNRDYILSRYRHQASQIANYLGRDKTCIFIIEPDFWQYYGDNRQSGGTIPGSQMRDLFNAMVSIIKSELPNALISWDLSAWIGEQGFRSWWGNFAGSQIDFINTSGGQSRGDLQTIKANELSWSFVSSVTGKKIIADCGYGVAGGESNSCNTWTNSANIKARIGQGVVALTQAKPLGYIPRLQL